jgi:hypothetical protein
VLAEHGVRAEAEAKRQLKTAYLTFVEEAEPERKNEAGRDLNRSIFGKDSVAEDSVFCSSAWSLAPLILESRRTVHLSH